MCAETPPHRFTKHRQTALVAVLDLGLALHIQTQIERRQHLGILGLDLRLSGGLGLCGRLEIHTLRASHRDGLVSGQRDRTHVTQPIGQTNLVRQHRQTEQLGQLVAHDGHLSLRSLGGQFRLHRVPRTMSASKGGAVGLCRSRTSLAEALAC